MIETPLSDVAIETQFPRFVESLRARLEVGRQEYGDRSLMRAPEELLGELAEEAMDLAGWGFMLWTRIQNVLGRVAEARPTEKAI